MLGTMSHILSFALFLGIFEGVQGHVDTGVSVTVNAHLPAFLVSFEDCVIQLFLSVVREANSPLLLQIGLSQVG